MGSISKRRKSSSRGIEEIWQREVGGLSPRTFAHLVGASQDLVLRLETYRKLVKHRGCVNTLCFNADGNILVSGSDDRMVILWNWDAGVVKLSFHSGHVDNVFQAKIMPYTDDKTIVTCAADGQVRLAQICEGGHVDTVKLGRHAGRVHKLAIEPGSPHVFYTCGEDGLVQHFDLRTRKATKLFTCHSFNDKATHRSVVGLNTIAIDPRNPNCFAVGGLDEYARVYDIRNYKLGGSTSYDHPTNCFCPRHLIGDSEVGITGLAFSEQSELLVSYINEHIYLFTKNLGLGPNSVLASEGSLAADSGIEQDPGSASPSKQDDDARPGPQLYKGHMNCKTIKGVGFVGPNSEYVVSGSDCGRIFIWRKKDSEIVRAMDADKHIVNCIEPHPYATILASSGIESDIKIWTPKATEPASLPVKLDEPKRNRERLFQFSSPEDLIMHILPLRRLSPDSGRSEEDWEGSTALIEYVMGSNDDNGNNSDDNGEASGHPGDCRMN